MSTVFIYINLIHFAQRISSANSQSARTEAHVRHGQNRIVLMHFSIILFYLCSHYILIFAYIYISIFIFSSSFVIIFVFTSICYFRLRFYLLFLSSLQSF